MTVIQQIYGTHCTFGTSALERREGEAASRVLGYSPRASSMPIEELRKTYRAIERYLYYYLPTDAPPDRKLELTAHTAPRRLLFQPSTADLQILTLVCYRQWDANRRSAGSYFAHALISNRAKDAPAWSVLDCLRLWGAAGWTVEDDPNITHELPPLVSLTDVLQSPTSLETDPQPLLNDQLLLEFLTCEQFSDGVGDWLPPRWREMPLQQRRDFFTLAFKGYFEVFSQQRDSLLLLVEPAASVVFFYGIARLLPKRMREALSFSTFETHPDRLTTKLAATSFDNPSTGDVKPDRYNRGFVLNTFVNGKATALRRKDSKYVDFILAKLTTQPEQGWQEVDQWLAEFEKAEADSPTLLEELIDAEDVTTQLLNPPQPISLTKMRASPKVKLFLQGRVCTSLSGPAQTELLDQILASHTHTLEVLKLLCSEQPGGLAQPARSYLLKRLPADLIAPILNEGVPAAHQFEAILPYINQHHQLPPNCEGLWTDAVAAGVPSDKPRNLPILTLALSRLEPSTIKAMIKKDAAPRHVFFISLLGVPPNANLENLLLKFAEGLDGNALVSVIQTLGTKTQQLPDYLLRVFQAKAIALVKTLADEPEQFRDKLEALKPLSPVLPKEQLNIYQGWQAIIKALQDAEARSKSERTLVKRLTEADYDPTPLGRSLYGLIKQVMPERPQREAGFSDDPRAIKLYHIVKALRYDRYLPPKFTVVMTSALDRGYWPEAPRPVNDDLAPVIDNLRKYKSYAVPAVVLVVAFVATLALWRAGMFETFAAKPKVPAVAERTNDGKGGKAEASLGPIQKSLTPVVQPGGAHPQTPAKSKPELKAEVDPAPAHEPVEVAKPEPDKTNPTDKPAESVVPAVAPMPMQEKPNPDAPKAETPQPVAPARPPMAEPMPAKPTEVAVNNPPAAPIEKRVFVVKEEDLVKEFPTIATSSTAIDSAWNITKEVVIKKNPDISSKLIFHGIENAFGNDANRIEVVNAEPGQPKTRLALADINAPASKQVMAEFEILNNGAGSELRCWLLPLANHQDRGLQNCIRHCVIELKGASSSVFVAMTKLNRSILRVKSDRVTNLSELGLDMLMSNTQLVLQSGTIFNGSSEDIEFGFSKATESQSRCQILFGKEIVGAAVVAPNGPHLKFELTDEFLKNISDTASKVREDLKVSIKKCEDDLDVLNPGLINLVSKMEKGPAFESGNEKKKPESDLKSNVESILRDLNDNLGLGKFDPIPKKDEEYEAWKKRAIEKIVKPAEDKKRNTTIALSDLRKQHNIEQNRSRLGFTTVKMFRVVKHNGGVSEILVPALFPPQAGGDTTFPGKTDGKQPSKPKDSSKLLD